MEYKESREAFKGMVLAGCFLVKRSLDGLGTDDVDAWRKKMSEDEDFNKLIDEAWQGAGKAIDELKEADWKSFVWSLVTDLVMLIPQIIEIFREEEEA